MSARALLSIAACAVVATAGCGDRGAPTSSVDDTTFIHTMVELQRAFDDTTLDSLMLDSVRHVILRRHGLSADGLVEAARAMSSDPAHAIKVWKAIDSGRYNVPAAAPIRHADSVPSRNHLSPPVGPPR